ncbi:MAG TPA: hypothetical protein VLJ59_01010 [Mycobacteriales bacterium]|nr:hypothetical protein [Mycobacteriales bacterium]
MKHASWTKAASIALALATGGAVAVLTPSSPAVAFFSGGLFLDIAVQSPATLIARGAAIEVPVNITCNSNNTFVNVQVNQRVGKKIASGSGDAQVACTGGHQRILLSVPASGVPFASGTAFATGFIFGCLSFCANEQSSATIQIQR